ncbi:MAG: hypothetical protein AMJ41_00245 [candidate division Zixibacteria bacterium DG_27]|nr:MAG: hypothetical protein AMJ41_00245 [candidate division Zixibacteria bacterium DG_27]
MRLSDVEWLDNEDKQCRDDRLQRLKWIIKEYPNIGLSLFHGGVKSHYLFEEARYCFVYGQYTASIMLSLSYVENSLATLLYASGTNDVRSARIVDLLKEAKEQALISESEFIVLDKVRRIRNPIAHFRTPDDEEDVENKAVKNGRHPYEVLETDAKTALKATFRVMARFSIAKQQD